ncbi:MAG: GDP-L-fucose synthase [Melioribacteraceae bacterium]|nr:GDP-L-fucose synthase [Melioribacteraceae bacterium]
MLTSHSKLYIAGHSGMVGSALMRKFTSEGFTNIVKRTFEQLDLRNQQAVNDFFQAEKPEYVIIAAAKVGGILANNTYRAQFLYDNLMIQSNIIHAAYLNGIKKLIFLGSSCIYPRDCPQPIKEEYLLTGPLEPTNEPYAIAKIAGIKLCENYYRQYGCNFYSVMPTNLYGPNDNYDLETSHVLPALIRKFHEAKINNSEYVEVWGTGKPRREFMHVDDLADAIFFLLNNVDATNIYNKSISHLNIGSGKDISIKELAELIKDIVEFKGNIFFDPSKPDGTPVKVLDISRMLNLNIMKTTLLRAGLITTYNWYSNYANQ